MDIIVLLQQAVKSCIGYICCSRSSGFLSGKWKNLQGEGRKADATADERMR